MQTQTQKINSTQTQTLPQKRKSSKQTQTLRRKHKLPRETIKQSNTNATTSAQTKTLQGKHANTRASTPTQTKPIQSKHTSTQTLQRQREHSCFNFLFAARFLFCDAPSLVFYDALFFCDVLSLLRCVFFFSAAISFLRRNFFFRSLLSCPQGLSAKFSLARADFDNGTKSFAAKTSDSAETPQNHRINNFDNIFLKNATEILLIFFCHRFCRRAQSAFFCHYLCRLRRSPFTCVIIRAINIFCDLLLISAAKPQFL